MEVQDIKNRFGIIGTSPLLDRAIDIARQVASTDLSVLITGESGSGKEVFPQIIHQLSTRKHGPYIAVNCGAIPEGTIDSELFGHEKGSFTGAHEARKGYFEVANGGTIFLDEVGELPLATQARLLRVLESGEFLKVGSSKVQKTDVRVVAATNVKMTEAVAQGRFREDLYYRLNSVPIVIPPLRDRKEDIYLLFRKFAADFAARYRMPQIKLTPEAISLLTNYHWPGNIRQLKNITEQISAIEHEREITPQILVNYLPKETPTKNTLPMVIETGGTKTEFNNEREILYKVLFDLKRDVVELKKMFLELIQQTSGINTDFTKRNAGEIQRLLADVAAEAPSYSTSIIPLSETNVTNNPAVVPTVAPQIIEEVEDTLSLQDKEKELIIKALRKHKGKRKTAAKELGISERTLYRKINEYQINE
jgi:transcriptional regulator with PAS, ATPase and Fis domain